MEANGGYGRLQRFSRDSANDRYRRNPAVDSSDLKGRIHPKPTPAQVSSVRFYALAPPSDFAVRSGRRRRKKEAVARGDGMRIGGFDPVEPGKGGDQHQKG